MKASSSLFPLRNWLLLFLLGVPFGGLHSASVSLTTSDVINTSSFNAAGNWSNAAAPSSGNEYFVNSGFILRTPAGVALDFLFNGNSLTLGNGSTAGTLYFKTKGVITINALKLNQGILTNAGYDSDGGTLVATLAGNMELLAGGGTFNTLASDLGNRTFLIQSTITGTGALTLTGGGNTDAKGLVTLSGSGTNTYSGGTVVNYAKVRAGKASAFGSSSATLNLNDANAIVDLNAYSVTVGQLTGVTGSRITSDAAGTIFLTVGNGVASGTSTYAGTIQNGGGTVGLVKTGTGIQILTGTNTYTGLTDVQAGTLRYGASNVIASGAVQVSGGTLDLQSFNDTVGAVTLANGSITGTGGTLTGASYTVQSGSISAILAGSAGLTKNTVGTVTLSGANSYSGGTTLNGGVLSVAANNHLGNASGALAFDGGTLQSTGTFSMNRATTLNAGGGIIEVAASQTLTQQGAIGGSGGLTKTGAGVLALSGANNYTGGTTVSAGTLVLSGGGSIGNSATVDVQSGATLDHSGLASYTFGSTQTLKGKGTVKGNSIVNGALQPGSSPGVLTFEGDLTLGSAANSTFEIQSGSPERGTTYDGVTVTGLLAYDGTLTLSLTELVADATYHLFDFGSYDLLSNFDGVAFSGGIYAGTFVYSAGFWTAADTLGSGQIFRFELASGNLAISAIPEPSSILLMTGGLMAIVLLRRRARN